MNVVWRFFMDQNQAWKWQQLSADRTVISESAAAFREYEGCLADARVNGHVFEPSQPRKVQGRSV